MEKYCKTCGRVFKDSDFKICPYCGNELSEREGRQPIPRKLRHQVFQRDNYRCRECGATKEQTRLHVDHIMPVSKGGTNDLSNLQTLCEECNRAKYTDVWVGGEINPNSSNKLNANDKWKKCPICGAFIPKAVKVCYYCKNSHKKRFSYNNKNKSRKKYENPFALKKSDLKTCPKCGHEVHKAFRRCWKCHEVFPDYDYERPNLNEEKEKDAFKICPKCGHEIRREFRRCWRCGEVFSESD